MTDFSFDAIKSVVDEIAVEEGIKNYELDVNEDAYTGGNFTSRIIRTIVSQKDGGKKKMNLLIKLTVMKEKGRDKIPLQSFFETEFNAYKFVLPELLRYQKENNLSSEKLTKFPKFYAGAYDYLKEYIIMEDLSCLGYELYGKENPLDYEHSRIVMRTLANLHAVSFAMKENDPERFSKVKSYVAHKCNYPEFICTMIKDSSNNFIPHIKSEEIIKQLKSLTENPQYVLEKCLDSALTEPYNTICHGDVWNNNMLFRKQNGVLDCIFVDYQIIRYSSPATDIMFNFYVSTEASFREKHFAQLCDEYYSALGSNLQEYGLDVGKVFPRDVFQKLLDQAAPLGILFCILSSALLLMKPGEEKKLEELVDDKSENDFSPTDAMMARVECLAEDIIKNASLSN